MDNSISPETEKHIRTLCDDIATAESLTDDLHDELYTHIEDKILGYMSGEETLSEADAFILAREHFGDRLTMRDQLEKINPLSTPSSFLRRCTIPAILYVGLSILFQCLFFLLHTLSPFLLMQTLQLPSTEIVYIAVYLWIHYKLIKRWKEKERNGEVTWYRTWSTVKLYTLILALIVIGQWMEISIGIYHLSNPGTFQSETVSILYWYIFSVLAYVMTIGTVLLWLLWFDVPQKPKWNILGIATAYTALAMLTLSLSHLIVVRPTDYIDSQNIEWVMQLPGTALLELENAQIMLDTSFVLEAIRRSISKVFFETLLIGAAYTLWVHYRNKRYAISNLEIAKR